MKRSARLVTAVVAVVAAASLALAACGSGGSSRSDGNRALVVVANFYPVAEAVTRVGGNRVRVTNLTPTGVEPHDIELTTRQVDALENADLLVYIGGGFQPAVSEIAKRRNGATVDAAENLGEARASGDPHFWLDPTLMRRAVQAVVDALVAASPPDATVFRANAERYEEELTALDGEFQRGLASCERKDLVTSHAAFSYLAKRYGLNQIAVAGITPEAEPDAARLATLAEQIQAKHITTVFFEELVSPKVAATLAREAKVKTAVLSPLEGLSQPEVDAGKDYGRVMRDNLLAIRLALGCT